MVVPLAVAACRSELLLSLHAWLWAQCLRGQVARRPVQATGSTFTPIADVQIVKSLFLALLPMCLGLHGLLARVSQQSINHATQHIMLSIIMLFHKLMMVVHRYTFQQFGGWHMLKG